MPRATPTFIAEAFPELDDLEIARILTLEPSEAEVLEALAFIDGGQEETWALGEPSTGRVAHIVTIVDAALVQLEEEEPA